jgi:hypothetical protein
MSYNRSFSSVANLLTFSKGRALQVRPAGIFQRVRRTMRRLSAIANFRVGAASGEELPLRAAKTARAHKSAA